MLLQIFKTKTDSCKATEAIPNDVGSITIDEEFMDVANIFEDEKVQIVNDNTGERFETYVIKSQPESGIICPNGAVAQRAEVSDVIISHDSRTPDEALSSKPISVFADENRKLKPV